MTPITKAVIRGWVYMAIISAVFGFWQNSVLAGVFMLLFLLFIEKLVRVLIITGPQSNAVPEPANESLSEDEDEFELYSEEIGHAAFVLDTDIDHRPCKNHFRLYSRYDTSSGGSEYEYRIEGTDVFVRLLQDYNENPGAPETWDARDGVVQEMDIRARWEKRTALRDPFKDIEKDMAVLKQTTEWSKLSSTSFSGGAKYFILAKKMPKSDARRFFRQELERLKMGIDLFTKEAAKLRLEVDDASIDRLRFTDERSEKLSDVLKKLQASAETFGISYPEFVAGNKLIAALQKMLG